MWFVALRVAGIFLGAFSLLLLATQSGEIQFKQWFAEWLRYLESGLAIPLEVIKKLLIDNILAFLRSFGWQLPELKDIWRPAFVLSWLMVASTARNSRSITALMIGGFALAFFGSLVSGLTGSAGISILAVTVWTCLLISTRAESTRVTPTNVAAYVTFVIVSVSAAILFGYGKSSAFNNIWTTSGTLVVLATLVLIVGLGFIRRFGVGAANYELNVGLDILFAMGLAFAFVAYMAEPPLW
jgi:hypothetical protein